MSGTEYHDYSTFKPILKNHYMEDVAQCLLSTNADI